MLNSMIRGRSRAARGSSAGNAIWTASSGDKSNVRVVSATFSSCLSNSARVFSSICSSLSNRATLHLRSSLRNETSPKASRMLRPLSRALKVVKADKLIANAEKGGFEQHVADAFPIEDSEAQIDERPHFPPLQGAPRRCRRRGRR